MRGRGRCSPAPPPLCWPGSLCSQGEHGAGPGHGAGAAPAPFCRRLRGRAFLQRPRWGRTLHRGTRPRQRLADKRHGRRPQPARRHALCVNKANIYLYICVFIHFVPPGSTSAPPGQVRPPGAGAGIEPAAPSPDSGRRAPRERGGGPGSRPATPFRPAPPAAAAPIGGRCVYTHGPGPMARGGRLTSRGAAANGRSRPADAAKLVRGSRDRAALGAGRARGGGGAGPGALRALLPPAPGAAGGSRLRGLLASGECAAPARPRGVVGAARLDRSLPRRLPRDRRRLVASAPLSGPCPRRLPPYLSSLAGPAGERGAGGGCGGP